MKLSIVLSTYNGEAYITEQKAKRLTKTTNMNYDMTMIQEGRLR